MKEKDKIRLQQIGQNLLTLRNAKGYTQDELSLLAEVDRAKISKIETGQVNLLLTTLLDLAEGLGVSPSELLKGTSLPEV